MTDYPDLVEATGYGTGPGLCGWNCRHSFGPFWPGISTNPYEKEPINAEANERAWELSQRQREMERKIRYAKTQVLSYLDALKATGDNADLKQPLMTDYIKAANRLQQYNAKYKAFCKDNNLPYGNVAPLAGAWIETSFAQGASPLCHAAPHLGARIEIHAVRHSYLMMTGTLCTQGWMAGDICSERQRRR
ncbi:MAG: phage minor capsid protein [Christensenellaceae bacterium]|jgi:hypothetical protein|nr:phage minor capsid protein [Christensenellaceae bacterium]